MRWGKPTKNKKRRDPRYFLNEHNDEGDELGGGVDRDQQAFDALDRLVHRAMEIVRSEAYTADQLNQGAWQDALDAAFADLDLPFESQEELTGASESALDRRIATSTTRRE